MSKVCGIGTDMCGCHSPYLKTEFKEKLTDILTKKERIEILKDYRRILENELESLNKEIKKLEEE